jgi:hypothetical protein
MKIMFKTIFLFLFILPLFTIAQQRWEVYIGIPDKYDYPNDLLESYDGGYLLTINTSVNSNYFGWLVKTDINGNQLWNKVIINEQTNIAYPTCSDENINGELVIAGYADNNAGFILKLNSCGEKIWCNMINEEMFDYSQGFEDVMFLENGDILAMLFAQSDDLMETDRIFLFYFDADGNLLWQKPYASYQEHAGIMDPTPFSFTKIDDFYIISGFGWFQSESNPNDYWLRMMFIKIDSLFNEEWLLPFGHNNNLIGTAWSSMKNLNGTISGVGSQRNPDNGDGRNSIIANFNSSGEEISYYNIPNSEFDDEIDGTITKMMLINNDSTYYTRSYYDYTQQDGTTANFIIDSIGNVLNTLIIQPLAGGEAPSSKTFQSKYINSVDQYVDGDKTDILLYKLNPDLSQAEYDTTTYVYDSLCDHQIVSDTIYLDDCGIITNLGEIPTPMEYYRYISTIPVHIFPNPATSGITFEFENTEYHKDILLRCYDINGRMVFEETLPPGQTQIKTTVSNWPGGMYVAVASSRTGGTGKEKFVVR